MVVLGVVVVERVEPLPTKPLRPLAPVAPLPHPVPLSARSRSRLAGLVEDLDRARVHGARHRLDRDDVAPDGVAEGGKVAVRAGRLDGVQVRLEAVGGRRRDVLGKGVGAAAAGGCHGRDRGRRQGRDRSRGSHRGECSDCTRSSEFACTHANCAHCPAYSRRPRCDGRSVASIAAAARSMSYSTRRNVAELAPVSSSSQAARGSRSRGWPTLPGIDQPAAVLQVQSRAGDAHRPDHHALAVIALLLVRGEKRERNVGVADQAHPRRLGLDAFGRLVLPQHVLPDVVARRGVVERDLTGLVGLARAHPGTPGTPRRCSGGSTPPRGRRWGRRQRGRSCRARPGRGCRPGSACSAGKPAPCTRRGSPRSRRRRPGTRARRAYAPAHVVEHRFERGQVRVDVADDP